MSVQAGAHDEKTIAIAFAGRQGQDLAVVILGEHLHAIDRAMEARVVRKIDMLLILAMIAGYRLVYCDKVSV